MRRNLLLATVLLVAGCAHTPHGFPSRSAPGITIVDTKQAEEACLRGRPFTLAFAPGDNDETLMVRFLRAARAQGATFVSDIELRAVEQQDGRWQECVTHVSPADHGGRRVVRELEPAHWIQVEVPMRVQESLPEVGVSCPSPARSDPQGRRGDGCVTVRRGGSSRTVYHTERRFVPATWHTDERWVSDWKLDASPPACTPVEPAAPATVVHATIYASR
jgi:hypothetical protein